MKVYLNVLLFISLYCISLSQSSNDLAGLKFCIDAGHGGYGSNDRHVIPDPGSDFWESESNFHKALALKSMLSARGATVYLTRISNTTVDIYDIWNTDPQEPSLTARYTYANANNVHWFHSIHSNATGGTNTSTNYTLVLIKENIPTRSAAFPQSITMSSYIYNHIRSKNRTGGSGGNSGTAGVYLDYSFYGGTNGGFNLGVLRGLVMPGQLSEGSFHDYYPETRRLLNNDYRKVESYGLYNAFLQYFKAPYDTIGIICGTQKSGTVPLNNISVKLLPNGKIYSGDAFNNGYFLFDSLSPGDYKVIFQTQGYPNDTVAVKLTASGRSIASTYPEHQQTLVKRNDSLRVTFTAPMDTAAVRSRFVIAPSLDLSFHWNQDRTELTLIPASLMPYKQTYTVTLKQMGNTPQPTVFVDNTTVTSNVGAVDFSFSFTTMPLPPVVLYTQPVPDDTAFDVNKTLGLAFSDNMDTASVRKGFSIEPIINGSFTWTNINRTLIIKPPQFEYETDYLVTLDSNARSVSGLPIDGNKDSLSGDAFVMKFRTMKKPTGVESEEQIPLQFNISQNYPNPFNPSTTIHFTIERTRNVQLDIYDVLGRRVKTIVQGELSAGKYSKVLTSDGLSSGMYFAVLQSENKKEMIRLTLIK